MVKLQEQEMKGNYKFNGIPVMTRGFSEKFGIFTPLVITETMQQIYKLVNADIADYFQVAIANLDGQRVKFYIIDDIDHYTFLLPEEY